MNGPVRFALAGTLALLGATPVPTAPVVHVNQLGFDPGDAKRAIVTSSAVAPLHWQLRDAKGIVAAQGDTVVTGGDAASGDHLHAVDFSRVSAPGTYRLTVGGSDSHPFPIAAGIYTPLRYAALNYFYQTRAGIAIEARFAGGARWARAAGHPHEVAPCFSGKDDRGNQWPGCGYTLDVTGGWYDAGDQGKYVVNGGISLWTLQNLYETGGKGAFGDRRARLPETGNGVDDLLDEARWEMRFLLAMQVPDGERVAVPVGVQRDAAKLTLTTIDAGGMAHHKVADRAWTALPTVPAEDPQPRLLYPPSTAATLNLAATAAQCARIWRGIDPAFAARCLTAAERAYAAALRNPQVFAPDTFTGSGGYGDAHLDDELYWATAELFATTRAPRYGDALRHMAAFAAPLEEPGWPSVAALGTITLATVPGVLPAAETAQQRALIVAAADRFLAEQAQSGFHLPYATIAYPWGSNSTILNRAMILGEAQRLTDAPRYRAAVVDAMDYVLGRNPLDRSYVTGFGWNPVQNPHHRFWAHSLDARLPGPPPGVLSGGPNSTSMSDDIARTMKGTCAPQRCWRDDIHAFALNEVAINWNAPLLWVAAYLDRPVRPAAGATPAERP